MSKLWRCYNCPTDTGVDWAEWSGEPKCPQCGLTPKDPLGGSRIVERVAVHLEPPHPVVKGRGSGTLVCTGKFSPGQQRTGLAAAVTCPECLKAPLFAKIAAEQDFQRVTDPAADFIIEPPKTENPNGD